MENFNQHSPATDYMSNEPGEGGGIGVRSQFLACGARVSGASRLCDMGQDTNYH